VFQVRKKFVEVINNRETLDPVCELTKTLQADFDKRYVPTADESGTKLTFKWGASLGQQNRYNTIHHFFFVAAFLDPRDKKLLTRNLITAIDYQLLQHQVQNLMEAEARKQIEGEKGTMTMAMSSPPKHEIKLSSRR